MHTVNYEHKKTSGGDAFRLVTANTGDGKDAHFQSAATLILPRASSFTASKRMHAFRLTCFEWNRPAQCTCLYRLKVKEKSSENERRDCSGNRLHVDPQRSPNITCGCEGNCVKFGRLIFAPQMSFSCHKKLSRCEPNNN